MYIKNVTKGEGWFITNYTSSSPSKAVVRYEDDHTVTFCFPEYNKTFHAKVPELGPYQGQFGIAISLDKQGFFLQDWKKGLFFYSLKNGELLWQFHRKHAFDVIALSDCVICYFQGDGVYSIDYDGNLIRRVSATAEAARFRKVQNEHFLLGPIRGKYQLWNYDFRKIAAIPEKAMNPNGFETFLIHKAILRGNDLSITGYEISAAEDQYEITNGLSDMLRETHVFQRVIDFDHWGISGN